MGFNAEKSLLKNLFFCAYVAAPFVVALIAQGSDPEFFGLDKNGNEVDF